MEEKLVHRIPQPYPIIVAELKEFRRKLGFTQKTFAARCNEFREVHPEKESISMFTEGIIAEIDRWTSDTDQRDGKHFSELELEVMTQAVELPSDYFTPRVYKGVLIVDPFLYIPEFEEAEKHFKLHQSHCIELTFRICLSGFLQDYLPALRLANVRSSRCLCPRA